ncbi:unnamed protein product [Durusdinium trenchii]|uniref:Protein kinase domain-containing protein n=1 Tax=Durusdinium trenchii TaxID=1381693 RepID=A0ABP0RYN0_9DINO
MTDVAEQFRITATGAIVGTPAYASPEQIESQSDVDLRTDIYSLGIIFYELLTGHLPFEASSPLTLLRRILENEPPPSHYQPELSREIDEVCLKAIAKQAKDRFQTMEEFETALHGIGVACAVHANITTAGGVIDQSEQRASTNLIQQLRSCVDNLSVGQKRFALLLPFVAIALCWLLLFRDQPQGTFNRVTAKSGYRPASPVSELGGQEAVRQPEAVDEADDVGQEMQEAEIVVSDTEFNSKDLRVQLPVPLGGWTKLTGRLWHARLQRDNALHFKIYMRCVDEQIIAGRKHQILEFEVTTLNSHHLEQASLLVDVDAYRDHGEFVVNEGWLMAPRDQIFEKYVQDPDTDPLSHRYAIEGVDLPKERLSIQDILAFLYNADVKTTEGIFRRMHLDLEAERRFKDQELDIVPPSGDLPFHTVRTKETSEELPVDYEMQLCWDSKEVPFTWGSVTLNYQQLNKQIFEARLQRDWGGLREGENLAELPAPDWTPEAQDPIPYENFAYISLPSEEGAWCRYEANLAIPAGNKTQSIKLNRVEVRVLNQEIIDNTPYRWIEVDVQTGGSLSQSRITETARLLLNEKRYHEERKFEFFQDEAQRQFLAATQLRVGNGQPVYVRFVPEEQDGEDRMKRLHGDKVPVRVPIRNVISLLFGARLTPNFLPFDIREHVSYALTDGLLRRHFLPNKVRSIPEQGDLSCLLVRPGRPVSIAKGNNVPPTTLGYDIYISEDAKEFPFRWVELDMNLFEEKNGWLGNRLFGGNLKLRAFGTGARSIFREKMDHIVSELDPAERLALEKSKIYREMAHKFVQEGETSASDQNRSEAIKWYQKFIDNWPETLVAHEFRNKIDDLERPQE